MLILHYMIEKVRCTITKQLDESYFTFDEGIDSKEYSMEFLNGTDGSDIYHLFNNHKDLKTDMDLYVYFNSNEELVGLKMPVKYVNREL